MLVDVSVTAERLSLVVGPEHVLVDADRRAGYETDWTGRYRGIAAAVVRPGSTEEVAAVVRWCAEHDHVIVPQGGNTGLVGGGVPRPGRAVGDGRGGGGRGRGGDDRASTDERAGRPVIVLSLRRLDHVGAVDTAAAQLTAGGGATLTAVRDRARAAGLDLAVDFAARDSATVGGAIAPNAGGSRVVRFGTMRRQLVGVEAVLASGDVVGSLAGLPKETAGLHWPSLLAGSEGTLGVVTAARLRLVPRYARTSTAMVAVESIADAVTLLASARSALPSLDAIELVLPPALDLVAEHLGFRAPVTPPAGGAVVMIDCAAHHDPTDELVGLLADPGAAVTASAVADDASRRERLLAFRDRITEAIAAASAGAPAYKLDVAVPVDRLPDLLREAAAAATADGCRLIPFGHLAEGNVHLNHLGVRDPDALADRVLHRVAELGGTISAEHGIGVAKTRWLDLVRSPAELAAQRAIKAALDPTDLLNPGVLTP